MGFSTVNIGQGNLRQLRAWRKNVVGASTEVPLCSYVASEITSITWSYTVGRGFLTVVMAAAHDFASGDWVTVSAAVPITFNVRGAITVVDTTTFRIALPNESSLVTTATQTTITNSGATVRLTGEVYCQRAYIYGYKASVTPNSDVVWLGAHGNLSGATIPLDTGGVLEFAANAGSMLNLGSLWILSTLDGDGAIIQFH